MYHFYISRKIAGGSAIIDNPEQVHHIRDVLRLKPGDDVSFFDSEGNEYRGKLATLEKKQAVFTISNSWKAPPRKFKISFACAVTKQAHMDDIVDKLTELGVNVIIPLETRRVVVRLKENRQSRLERWRKIARSAAEQSHRNTIPLIPDIMDFKAALDLAGKADLKLIPTLVGVGKTLKEALENRTFRDIFVLIGPEGDFTPAEVEEATQAGFIPISLGDSVLRVETAAIAVAGYLRFCLPG